MGFILAGFGSVFLDLDKCLGKNVKYTAAIAA
jgi:hypothetical protein